MRADSLSGQGEGKCNAILRTRLFWRRPFPAQSREPSPNPFPVLGDGSPSLRERGRQTGVAGVFLKSLSLRERDLG